VLVERAVGHEGLRQRDAEEQDAEERPDAVTPSVITA